MKKEIRLNSNITNNDESRHITGYAIVFESQSEDLGFFETIHRGAVTDETIANSDIFATFNHDNNKILARSKNGKGTLQLTLDEKGLKYDFEAPHTELGNEVLEVLKRGDADSSSFAFTVSPEEGSERWYKKDGKIYRDIYKIDKLYDVSIVWNPAYSETTASARAKEVEAISEEIDAKMNLLLDEIDKL